MELEKPSTLDRRQFLVDSAAAGIVLTLPHNPLPGPAANGVVHLWSGALSATAITVCAKLQQDSSQVRLLASRSANMSNPITSPAQATNGRLVRITLANLQPNSQYYYRLSIDGTLDSNKQGQFHTPGTGPFSFTFAFASCALTGSSHAVFNTIRQHNPLFFVHMGDLHYQDIGSNDQALYRAAFDTVLASPTQATLYQQLPIAYMWDDHDYGPNDSDKTSPSRLAARLAYQEYVPHYPLVAGSGNVAIYQAFTIGRVRFILTDTRSERDTTAVSADSPQKTMLGAAQKAWFKQQLLQAKDQYPVIIWVSTSPWIADSPGSGIDNWNGFRAERREIADFVQQNNIQGLFMISGDVHMLAIDDGRNNRYATNRQRGFPIMQAAALDNSGSFFTTNTYSEGQYPGRGQFGLMTINDNGQAPITIQWQGLNTVNEEVVSLMLTVPPSPRLAVSPHQLTFVWQRNGGVSLLEHHLQISNIGTGAMPWEINLSPTVPWLQLSATQGTVAAESSTELVLRATPTVAVGLYETKLTVSAKTATDSSQEVLVRFLVTNEPATILPIVIKS